MNDIVISLFASTGFDKSAQGLAGAGRRLADELGCGLRAVILGAEADSLAAEVARVADAVIVAEQAEPAQQFSIRKATSANQRYDPASAPAECRP